MPHPIYFDHPGVHRIWKCRNCFFCMKKESESKNGKNHQEFRKNHQEFQVPKMEVLKLIRLILGVGFPLHKPYIQLIQVSTSSLGTLKVW